MKWELKLSSGDSEQDNGMLSWHGLPQAICQQAAWWGCVLLMGWSGTTIMLFFIALHLYITRQHFADELQLLVISLTVGLLLDNTLAVTRQVSYVGDVFIGGCPMWLAAIWAGFGPTLRYSQKILVRSRMFALLTGFIGGPLAYIGGEKLERLTVNGWVGLASVSLGWGIAMFIIDGAQRKTTSYSPASQD